VLVINDDETAPFPHAPEPSRATAAQVAAVVRAGRADIGFVHDADGERLVLVDETGRAHSEELTLALAASIALQRRVGPVVTNVSTSGLVDRVARLHGAEVVRVPVGQAFVSQGIVTHDAVIGGEGNGAVAVPAVQATHDAAACMALLVDHLAASSRPLSALVDALPVLAMVKEAHHVAPHKLFTALQAFRDEIDGVDADVDLADGVKLSWPDAWLHVRASNTQSLVRVIAEADTPARARELADWARDRLRI
ncbi:MAG: hypothetical protein MUF60_07885, partial [Vicinamibacterales bacterium]|jgi:phosphomannomutase|nr:hypothetical protein [Vicinamibacterales bacterium]